MTKAEIVNKISDNTGVDKTVVLAIVEEFMTQVKDSLIERENVYLRGFGSFIVKERKQKGEIVDAYWKVSLTKVFDDEKEPCGNATIIYQEGAF